MAHYGESQIVTSDHNWYFRSIVNDLKSMVNGVRALGPRNEPLDTDGDSYFVSSASWASTGSHGRNRVRKLPVGPGLGGTSAAPTPTGTIGTTAAPAFDMPVLNRTFPPPYPQNTTLPMRMRSPKSSGGGGKDSSDTEWQEVSSRVSQETSSSGDRTWDIPLSERLKVTHPIWYLPTLTRQGAVHLLRRRDMGTFIVRASSHPDKLAISVRLPELPGPPVEHYLLEKASENGASVGLRLEGSSNIFNGIYLLVTHYCQCCDELPVQLLLPKTIATATRPELTALSHLGQEYWVTYVNNPSPVVREPPPPLPRRSWTDSVSRRSNLLTFGSPLASSSPVSSSPSEVFPAPAQFLLEEPKKSPVKPQPPPRWSAHSPTVRSNGTQTPNSLSPDSPTYFRGNLADRASDYEDIWPPSPSSEFSTFRPTSTVETQSGWALPQGNQTDQQKALVRDSFSDVSALSVVVLRRPNKPGNLTVRVPNPETRAEPEKVEKMSSPCYSEPVDAIHIFPPAPLDETVARVPEPRAVVMRTHTIRPPRPVNPPQPPPRRRSVDITQRRSIAESHQMSVSALPSLTALSASLGDLRTQSPETEDPAKDPDPEDCSKLEAPDVVVDENSILPPPPLPLESWWPLDSSWEWMSQVDAESSSSWNTEDKISQEDEEDEETEEDDRSGTVLLRDHGLQRSRGRRAGLQFPLSISPEERIAKGTSATVEELIVKIRPELLVNAGPTAEEEERKVEAEEAKVRRARRVSDYDNMSLAHPASTSNNQGGEDVGTANTENVRRTRVAPSETGSTVTEFSEPWDTNPAILNLVKEMTDNKSTKNTKVPCGLFPANDNDDSRPGSGLDDAKSVTTATTLEMSSDVMSNVTTSTLPPNSRLSSWRLRHDKRQGQVIREYVFSLGKDQSSTFGKAIGHFIQCTMDSREPHPHVVMRNVRQFMNGIKNYLVKHGEGHFDSIVKQEREKLNEHEFLNLDAILESVLHKMVIEPLQNRIIQLFVNEHSSNGALKALSEGIKMARLKTPEELGVKPRFRALLDVANMGHVQRYLLRLQKSSSPLRKLDNFLAAMHALHSLLFQDTASGGRLSFNAEELLPSLAYTLAQCGMIAAEVEAEYMWGLLPPSVLASEGCYYVTTLSSAVQFLKNLPRNKFGPGKMQQMSLHAGEYHGVMRVLIPDELNGNIATRTIPIRPTMTTKDICRMIAHKFHIPNPQDHSLYKLENGEEILLTDSERPHVIKMEMCRAGVDCSFAYKRTDAKIAWPIKSFSSIT